MYYNFTTSAPASKSSDLKLTHQVATAGINSDEEANWTNFKDEEEYTDYVDSNNVSGGADDTNNSSYLTSFEGDATKESIKIYNETTKFISYHKENISKSEFKHKDKGGSISEEKDTNKDNDAVDAYATLYVEMMCMMLEKYDDMQHQQKNSHLNTKKITTKKEGSSDSVDYQQTDVGGHGDDNHRQRTSEEKKNKNNEEEEEDKNIVNVADQNIQVDENYTKGADDKADDGVGDVESVQEDDNESDNEDDEDVGYNIDNDDSTEVYDNEKHDIENYFVTNSDKDANHDVNTGEKDANSVDNDEVDDFSDFITVHSVTDTTPYLTVESDGNNVTDTNNVGDSNNVSDSNNVGNKTNEMGILNETFAIKFNSTDADGYFDSNIDGKDIASMGVIIDNLSEIATTVNNDKTSNATTEADVEIEADSEIETATETTTEAETDTTTVNEVETATHTQTEITSSTTATSSTSTSTSSNDKLQLLLIKSINYDQANAILPPESHTNTSNSDDNEMNIKYEIFKQQYATDSIQIGITNDSDIEIISLQEQLLPTSKYYNITQDLPQNKYNIIMNSTENNAFAEYKPLSNDNLPNITHTSLKHNTSSQHVNNRKSAIKPVKYDIHLRNANHLHNNITIYKSFHNLSHQDNTTKSNTSLHITPNLMSLRNLTRFTQILSNTNSSSLAVVFYDNYDIPLGYLRWMCKRLPPSSWNKSHDIFDIFDEYAVTKPTGNGTHNVDGSVISTTTQPDSGYIALIVIGSLLGSSLVLGVLLYSGYRYCSRRSINSMNFENPVYRKTTEDHFSLEKNLPVRMYPSTVDEESKEPLKEEGTECV